MREDRVRRLAIEQFEQLGYTILDGSQEEFGICSATGRESLNEVVLFSRLRDSLRSLNPTCNPAQLDAAIANLNDGLNLRSLEQANQQVHTALYDGIKVDARGHIVVEDDANDKPENAPRDMRQDTHKTVSLINWRESHKNDFVLVSHLWVNGKRGKRCLDLVGFVNGLPLLLLEIADSNLRNTFDKIDQDYKQTLLDLFWYNAFIVVADTFTSKMGSLTASWEHFFQWKRVHNENEAENTKLSTLIEGTCDKTRLLDIVENFTIFDEAKGLQKLVARNHQYLGVNNAVAALKNWETERAAWLRGDAPAPPSQHGKLGVFWHTQGSGKSYSMVFFVRKVQRTVNNAYTFVVVTDRDDLDTQIYENFKHTGTIYEHPEQVRAKTAQELKQLLTEKHLLLFTLIQKFYSETQGQTLAEISDNPNIIVLADEAHRTQYDTLARNMRSALPRASFLGFTGTPLMDGEGQTRETFGNYVSIYNFRRAINDGITVPLFYENVTPQISLENTDFQEDMLEILDGEAVEPRQEQRIASLYARNEEFFVKGERLDEVAERIVQHFMERGYQGKAMVVSINKITTVRLFNRVKEQWERYQANLQATLEQEIDPDKRVELEQKIEYMEQTERAVVVSFAHDDVKRFADFSAEHSELVEILPHHELFKNRKLDDDFKNATNALRIVFVCGMWITGFDVPCLSTLYLDRPMKGHTLMQTIARVNRVFQDKNNGLIVDFASNMSAIERAVLIYAREDTSDYSTGDPPIADKSELVQTLREKLIEAERFCAAQRINVPALLAALVNARTKQRQKELLAGTINTLVVNDKLKLDTLLVLGEVTRLYNAVLPDAAEEEFTAPVHLYKLIKAGIYETMHPTGFGDILGQVTRLVRESIDIQPHEVLISADTLRQRGSFALTEIDLDSLADRLHTGYKHIKAEQLRQLLYAHLLRMIQVNPNRTHYMEKLERAISRYNRGSANAASDPPIVDPQANITPLNREEDEQRQNDYIDALVEVTAEVAQEEHRAEQEELDEKQLAILDILTHNIPLNPEEHAQFKDRVKNTLQDLHPVFAVIDWQKKQKQLSLVRLAIKNKLLSFLPTLSASDLQQRGEALELYMREHYKKDDSTSVA